jgi:hypothetical protein
MADQNDEQERLNRDGSERGEAGWGDSGRSEDWTNNQRYGERQGWDVDSSYGTDWEVEKEDPLWEKPEDDPDNRPNPEALTSGQSGTDGESFQPARAGEIKPEMSIFDRKGEPVGVVREVRQSDVLVSRAAARDIYIPLKALLLKNGLLRLDLPASEIHMQGWEMPPVIATPMTGGTAGMPDELKDESDRS